MNLYTGSEAFTAELVASYKDDVIQDQRWARIELKCAEMKYSFRVNWEKGQWQPDDIVKIYVYGDLYELPCDILYQLKLSISTVLDSVDQQLV